MTGLDSSTFHSVWGLLKSFGGSHTVSLSLLKERYALVRQPFTFEKALQIASELKFVTTNENACNILIISYLDDNFRLQYIRHILTKQSGSSLELFRQKAIRGRIAFKEDYKYPNVHQLFDYAGLYSGTDEEVVRFWDDLACDGRDAKNQDLLERGRIGERLSLDFERARINSLAKLHGIKPWEPLWRALDDSGLGYDIESFNFYEPKKSWASKPVEVKASKFKDGSFFLTANEHTKMFAFKKSYELHLWRLEEKELAILKYEDVAPHIPANREKGKWTTVEIGFEIFTNRFLTSSPG